MSARLSFCFSAVAALLLFSGCENQRIAVTTYHYDNLRTGWNHHEEHLKPQNVQSPKFKLLHPVSLDDQVDTQPLVVPEIKITAGSSIGEHEVVYVATEGNTIYAIDAKTGAVLLSPNFGPPVPTPLGCGNNGPNVGINGTPVIDHESKTMYVIVYTLEAGNPAYRLHALDLGNLTDKIPPVLVTASHQLSNHTTFNFDARYQRQRPALLLVNGNVYAGFGSFCDFSANLSRGWLLGWKAGSLIPLPANQLNDTQPSSPNNFFLSSIWMSGYGVAADHSGSLFFVTGNSDYSGTTYDGVTNIQESVVKLSGDLATVQSIFTPADQASLENTDNDYGSGGALLLPEQSGATPRLAAAAGKEGSLFILNRDNLGGYTSGGPDKVVGKVDIGGCWCGPSYFSHDGPRIVSSGGDTVNLWKLDTSTTPLSITKEASSPALTTGQDPGFFTSVSSDGDDHIIIWAVSRPINNSPANVSLYAFDGKPSGSNLTQLFSGVAGTWPNTGGNSNIVPVVANGKVFVASYKQLSIFGLQ
ncbi:MAG TPA: hypothetical protein VKT53_09105 [Candidatus Acidoferrum sp.]|nr:hypothetical protein [Candidatus Acidoferrum sp.]